MQNIRDLTIEELESSIISFSEEKYRAKQVYNWLHKNTIKNLDEASNISKSLKYKISENFDISMPSIYKEFKSNLDETKKYLILLNDNNIIESVLMKYKFGYSICISSQVGCNMGCKFCASTIGGLKRNLEVFELLSQIYLIQKHNDIKISNIVIMGSGEPLHNYDNIIKFINIISSDDGQNISTRNITISTCGIVPYIKKLAETNLPINLALSLHAPSDVIRKKIMPIANKYSINDVLSSMYEYFDKTKRKLTFEYCLIKDINSSDSDALMLANLLKKHFDKKYNAFVINLIPVNEVLENSFKRPNLNEINRFKDILSNNNLSVTVRRELGKDISGSCGQLRASVK